MIIKYFAYYRDDTKCKSEELDIAPLTALELIRYLAEKHGKHFAGRVLYAGGKDIDHQVIFLLNGRNIDFLDGSSTMIGEDDTVSLFPRVAGG